MLCRTIAEVVIQAKPFEPWSQKFPCKVKLWIWPKI